MFRIAGFRKWKDYSAVESYKRRRFATSADASERVSISAMMRSSRPRPCMAGPAMNMESRNRVVRLRSMPLARWWVLVAMLPATASPAPCFAQGTLEQRLACTPDVLRFCSAFIPNADEITTCLRGKNAELSDACRTAVETGTKQLPGASDDTGVRERAAR